MLTDYSRSLPHQADFLHRLPLEKALKDEMLSLCQTVLLGKNEVIAREGKLMKMVPLLLEGSIRVYRQDPEIDREILLYYIEPGETCMMSIVASFTNMTSQVNAITEKKSKMLLIPVLKVKDWQLRYPAWNTFIINTFLNRYTELLTAFNEMCFQNVDKRLERYLKQYSKRQGMDVVPLTHQELANELGTTRVVISRLLKSMEKEGILELKRGLIELKDI